MASFCSEFIYIWSYLFKTLKKSCPNEIKNAHSQHSVYILKMDSESWNVLGEFMSFEKLLETTEAKELGKFHEWQHNLFWWGNGLSGRIIYNVLKLSQGLSVFVFYVGSRETHGWIHCPWLEEISYFPLYPRWLSFQANFWHEISPHCHFKSCPSVILCRDTVYSRLKGLEWSQFSSFPANSVWRLVTSLVRKFFYFNPWNQQDLAGALGSLTKKRVSYFCKRQDN